MARASISMALLRGRPLGMGLWAPALLGVSTLALAASGPLSAWGATAGNAAPGAAAAGKAPARTAAAGKPPAGTAAAGKPPAGTAAAGKPPAGTAVAGKPAPSRTPGSLTVTSPAFAEQKSIPVKYSCDGANMSPPLAWSAGPLGTSSYALIVEDPDAPFGTFTHWIMFNIPSSITRLSERVWSNETLEGAASQGSNDFPNLGYGGPCPPRNLHHYYFRVYALDSRLELPSGAKRHALLKAMEGHVLAEGRLVGLYEHQGRK